MVVAGNAWSEDYGNIFWSCGLAYLYATDLHALLDYYEQLLDMGAWILENDTAIWTANRSLAGISPVFLLLNLHSLRGRVSFSSPFLGSSRLLKMHIRWKVQVAAILGIVVNI